MAHNLANNYETGGKSFYSLRQAGWHTLGTVVQEPLSRPGIIQAAGLNYTADKKTLYTSDMAVVPDHVAMVRSDNGAILSVVSRDYQQVQNSELFDWLQGVAGVNEMILETAGALGDGGRVWLLARIPHLDCVIGKDASLPFLLITNGHTGRHALKIVPTLVRVVCENTLRMATAGDQQNTLSTGWEVRHRSGIKVAMSDIATAYDSAFRDLEMTSNANMALADTRSTADSFLAIVHAAGLSIKAEADETARAKQMREDRMARLAEIRASETCNVEGTEGSVYSDLQAVTEYLDYEGGRSDASRFESALFGGERDQQKAKAWEAALALV